ncbi:MAG: hypothetical protein UHD09_06275 [Bifidobacterium sp.]|nr:hypothetical protein [Bifidobacterium sp.]
MSAPRLDTLMRTIDLYAAWLESTGVSLDAQGFPCLPREWYAQEMPAEMVPFHRRVMITCAPDRAALCFYTSDQCLYPRLARIRRDLGTYRSFGAVVGMDVTVTRDMDPEWQREIMLLNSLFTAVLGANGVKVIANLRCGHESTLPFLEAIPMGVPCASEVLGCARTEADDQSYLDKLLQVRPSMVLLYGKWDRHMQEQVGSTGIPWKRYPDAHSRCRQAYRNRLQRP